MSAMLCILLGIFIASSLFRVGSNEVADRRSDVSRFG